MTVRQTSLKLLETWNWNLPTQLVVAQKLQNLYAKDIVAIPTWVSIHLPYILWKKISVLLAVRNVGFVICFADILILPRLIWEGFS
jgi:uncharacterized membrane protein YdfJ with MMPL/SSD domain